MAIGYTYTLNLISIMIDSIIITIYLYQKIKIFKLTKYNFYHTIQAALVIEVFLFVIISNLLALI